jgi:pimeloyl-ACP methyl ester carboxylesterase
MSADNTQLAGHWLAVQGLRTHYQTSGEGSAVILLHGGGNDWQEWEESFTVLARHFRVYALDLPGFGLSEPCSHPVSPPWFSLFLRDFMDAAGITHAHVVGHSLGGAIALTFALDFPEKVYKMVLVDSAGLGQVTLSGRLILFLIRAAKRITGKEKDSNFRPGGPIRDWLLADRLPELRPPVMIVWGERDRYYPPSLARLAQSLIPDCELHIFPGCGHAPHRERPDEFNELVCEFLSR